MVSNGQVAMIENAGHYPATEYPQATADVILPFLALVRQPVRPTPSASVLGGADRPV
jgi:hypothetical protein